MRRSTHVALSALLVTVLSAPLVSGCTTPPVSATVAVAAAAPLEGDVGGGDLRLAEPVRRFGFELLAQAAKADTKSGSTVVSPVSVAAALSMTLNGAQGETADEMRRALHLEGLDPDRANDAWANVLRSFSEDEGSPVRIANSLWADAGVPFDEAFLDADRDYFGAEIRSLDLQAPGTPDTINGWVSEQTGGRITDLVGSIDRDAVLELVNAVYFSGRWETPFDEALTEEGDFTLSDGTKVAVPMMERTGDMPYELREDGTQVVRLAYEGEQGMYVLLPAPGRSADELVAALGEESPNVDGLRAREGTLQLPRFEARSRFSLGEALRSLGMKQAFDPALADFGKMAELQGLCIGKVAHQTFVVTDEEGSEAAAATQVEMTLKGAMTVPADEGPFEMRVERPFVFVITDTESGLVLFAGIVRDPRSGQ